MVTLEWHQNMRGIAMKKLVFTFVFLIVAAFTATNAQQITTPTENKTVTHVIGNHFDVVYTDVNGNMFQEGQYLKIDERFKPHGIWKLYDRNSFELVTTAKYDKGEQIWVETIVDGEVLRVNQYDLKVKRLEDRIAALEQKVKELE